MGRLTGIINPTHKNDSAPHASRGSYQIVNIRYVRSGGRAHDTIENKSDSFRVKEVV